MKRFAAPALLATVLALASTAHAHPGHPVVPGFTHEQSHVVIGLLSVVGVVIVTLAGSLVFRATRRRGVPQGEAVTRRRG